MENHNKDQQRTEFYGRSSMGIFETTQESTCADTLDDAVLSYEYKQTGFTINLMKRSVLLFNHNIKKNVTAKQLRKNNINKNVMPSTLRKNMNSIFIYPYSNIREINYSLPTNEFEEAVVCILTDDILNPSWEFNVPTNSNTQDLCEQLVEIFNSHIFIFQN
ncbi:hypothetical protein N8I43_004228 [Salmonella enterica]|nr:hypothetical protein [Salmonella enterica]